MNPAARSFLTSDRPPSEMTLLDDRLRTRFEWGLLVDVAPPDFETRLAIVKNKAAILGMELPDKIAAYIAENVTANVRQLEGTINKIMAYKDLLGNDTDEGRPSPGPFRTCSGAITNTSLPRGDSGIYQQVLQPRMKPSSGGSSASGMRCRPVRSPCT